MLVKVQDQGYPYLTQTQRLLSGIDGLPACVLRTSRFFCSRYGTLRSDGGLHPYTVPWMPENPRRVRDKIFEE